MFRSRKAVFNVLLAVIITVVIGLLFIIIGYQIHKKSTDVNADQKCRMSILAKHGLGKTELSKTAVKNVGFECPRDALVLDIDDVEKYRKIDDDLLKVFIAEEMRSCWSKVGAGKLDPFNIRGTVNEKYCMVCTDLIFDSSIVEQAKKQSPEYELKGLQYWVAANKLPGMKTSLYEYITGKRPTEEALKTLKASENNKRGTFNMDQKYVVAWRVEKLNTDWWSKLGLIVGCAVPIVGVFTLPSMADTLGAMIDSDTAGSGAGTSDLGAGLCLGVYQEDGDSKLAQEVCVVPEDVLSTEFDFEKTGNKKEFCTKMIN